ncbi:MAG: hypothetical protein RLZZ293_1434, partial [Pseudomonadota bacterium]
MLKYLHPLTQINFTSAKCAWAIEASAGTGKTWTIERLYVKALLECQKLRLNNILVVTFTEAATIELKKRILNQIQETIELLLHSRYNINLLSNSNDPFKTFLNEFRQDNKISDGVTILTRAVQLFDQAAIFTIHGFCKQVLQNYPIECKINLPINIDNDKSLMLRLVEQFYREQILNHSSWQPNQLELALANINLYLSSRDYNLSIIDKLYNLLPRDLIWVKQGHYQAKYQLVSTEPILSITDLAQENLTKEQVLSSLQQGLITHILANYSAYRDLKLGLSFDELIQLVYDAIANSNEFAEKLYQNYPVAFIDEFQDTDWQQWIIFSQMYRLDQPQLQRGKVVVVGDPKQAIYSFRGADIHTYLQAIRQIGIGQKLSLTDNYRSHASILNFLNTLFNASNQNNADFLGKGIDYQQIKPCAQQFTELPSLESIKQLCQDKQLNHRYYEQNVQIIGFPTSKNGQNTELLLNAITYEILLLLNSNPSLKGKIAILVEKNSQASQIVKFMRKYGIKATELQLKSVFTTSSALDLLRIIDAISDLSNNNKINLALTSKIFNFSLNKLAHKEQYQAELEQIYARFFHYQQIFSRYGIMPLIYQLITDVAEQQQLIANRELANLIQLGELLHKHSKKVLNNYELIHWFKEKINQANNLMIEDNDSEEELIRLDNDDEQIIITTQHKAKGLEFEVLFCPFFRDERQKIYDVECFTNLQNNQTNYQILASKQQIEQYIFPLANAETQRLNYVALTRAKTRLYIYLPSIKINKDNKSYSKLVKPSMLDHLFGFPQSRVIADGFSHPLFNYPELFSDGDYNKFAFFKDPQQFTNVCAYQRVIHSSDLDKLKLSTEPFNSSLAVNYSQVNSTYFYIKRIQQSYSGITHNAINHDKDHYSLENNLSTNNWLTMPKYRYNILNGVKDKNQQYLSGAKFGLLFHELCENYPLNENKLTTILTKHNLNQQLTNHDEYYALINDAFTTPLLAEGLTLAQIHDQQHYQAEFGFNLQVNHNVDLSTQLVELLTQNYGENHPYTQAAYNLDLIKSGFLNGFIDLFFEYQGKYWVLDYKTNSLNNYQINNDEDNQILQSMAQHHYYLQYLLYLVAIKRHLETIYLIDDASHLLGGAIYFYVKGCYVEDEQRSGGILVDSNCQLLVQQLD